MAKMISVTDAHRRFGDLARIRNGHTTWIDVEDDGGIWKPVFDGFLLVAYEFHPLSECSS